jgi:hypothetical protein
MSGREKKLVIYLLGHLDGFGRAAEDRFHESRLEHSGTGCDQLVGRLPVLQLRDYVLDTAHHQLAVP